MMMEDTIAENLACYIDCEPSVNGMNGMLNFYEPEFDVEANMFFTMQLYTPGLTLEQLLNELRVRACPQQFVLHAVLWYFAPSVLSSGMSDIEFFANGTGGVTPLEYELSVLRDLFTLRPDTLISDEWKAYPEPLRVSEIIHSQRVRNIEARWFGIKSSVKSDNLRCWAEVIRSIKKFYFRHLIACFANTGELPAVGFVLSPDAMIRNEHHDFIYDFDGLLAKCPSLIHSPAQYLLKIFVSYHNLSRGIYDKTRFPSRETAKESVDTYVDLLSKQVTHNMTPFQSLLVFENDTKQLICKAEDGTVSNVQVASFLAHALFFTATV